jgi:hypothetical protein
MTEQLLELHFAGHSDVELVESHFTGNVLRSPSVVVRGKTSGAFRGAGTFQWTAGVRAFCILCVKSVLQRADHTASDGACISGFKGSLAASLDYAISKKPIWFAELCGLESNGQPFARRLMVRTNPERKRPGPVTVALSEKVLDASKIRISWNGRIVDTAQSLQQLLDKIQRTRRSNRQRGSVLAFPQPLEAIGDKN